ncbi:MAG TPA: TolC family protein [Vicinamibacteria bacterium]|nr:TolC family protein [Vicinamibacteria bacterium]
MIRQFRLLALAAVAHALLAGTGVAQETTPAAPAQGPANTPDGRPELPLSLQDVVTRALENNVDIAVERFNPQASEENVRELQGFYEPLLYSTLLSNSRTDPARNVFAGAEAVDTATYTYDFGGLKELQTGGNLRVDFTNSRSSTNSVFSTFNPSFGSNFNAQLTQPLLRGFRIDATRYQIRVARNNRQISEVQFRQTVVNTVANVRSLYNDLLYAIDNLEAQRQSLALARRLLEENEIRVRVGTMAPLDVVAAESEVASREETVILAEAAVLDAEDAIKRSIFPESDPTTWASRIVPTDRPTAEPIAVDTDAAVRNALEKRTDLFAARKNLENAESAVQLANNQELPRIDLVASYGTTGIGGTQIEREGLGGTIIRTVPGGYGDALGNVFGRDFPTWTLGFNISYPIFNRSADAAEARAELSREQTRATLRRLEMLVTAEVRSAVRAVETNLKRVESTRAARVLQERRLDAEEKRFAAGMSTNFFVTQAQRDLALAQVAELRAIADYRNSLVNFERVQEAGGGVSFAGSSGGTASRSTGTQGAQAGGSGGGQNQQP